MDGKEERLARDILHQLERIADALAPRPQAVPLHLQSRGLFQANAVLHDDKCEINMRDKHRCNCEQRNGQISANWQNVDREMGVPERRSPCAQRESHPSHEWSGYSADRLVSFRCNGVPGIVPALYCNKLAQHTPHRWIEGSDQLVWCEGDGCA